MAMILSPSIKLQKATTTKVVPRGTIGGGGN